MKYFILVLLALSFAACNSSDSAPTTTTSSCGVDGSYQLTSETCAGNPVSVGTAFLTISGMSAGLNVIVSGSCTINYGITISCSGANVVTQQVSKTCGNTCSGAECSGSNTTPQTQITGTYSKTGTTAGSTLTLDFTNYICANASGGGSQEDIKVLTKQ